MSRDWWPVSLHPLYGCWEWQGSTTHDGYGLHRGRVAHAVVWEAERGQLEAGKQLDHTCRNRRCVRPEHLEPVTARENLRRRDYAKRRKAQCAAGHDAFRHSRRTPQGGSVCLVCAPVASK